MTKKGLAKGLGKGLGKGLDTVIPEKIKQEDVSRETLMDITKVEPNRSQPRKVFDEDTLHELAESVKQYGIIQPLVVRKKDDYYEIIAGERRWRAARMAGLKKIPVVVKEYDDQQTAEIALVENIQREDLNPIEEAQAYQRLMREFGLKQDQVAEKVGKSRVTITNAMRLLKLCKDVQQMLIENLISEGHGRSLLPLDDEEQQIAMALKIVDERLSVRETERQVKNLLQPKVVKKEKIEDNSQKNIFYQELENRMKDKMGTKVMIQQKSGRKGKIEIEYYSEDELERLVDIILSMENE